MAIGVPVRKVSVTQAGPTSTFTFSIPTTLAAGTQLLVAAAGSFNRITNFTDSQLNTYEKDQSFYSFTNSCGLTIFSTKLATTLVGGVDTASLVYGGGSQSNVACLMYQVAGLDPTTWFDKTSAAESAGSTTADSGATAATTVADELLLGVVVQAGSGNVLTPGGGATLLDQLVSNASLNLAVQYQIVAATGAYHATATGSIAGWAAGIATYAGLASSPVAAATVPGPMQVAGRSTMNVGR